MTNLSALPTDLPRSVDDGACDHLPGMALPHLSLKSTSGGSVSLGTLSPGRTIIYCYPMTGLPGTQLPDGWDAIPGASGCTPQSCAFREHHADLAALDASVYGLSSQPTEYQREMVERLHLPFEVLSDAELRMARALRLPTFEVDGIQLIKRLTLVILDGRIEHVFYPVFPPDEAAEQIVRWLQTHQ